MKGGPSYRKLERGSLAVVRGIKAAGIHSGIKKGKRDLALIFSTSSAVAAGVFTRNLYRAAPVVLCQERIGNLVQAIVINSGIANACTGEKGLADARETADLAARLLQVAPEQVLVCSTGVIGRPMPMDKIYEGLPEVVAALTDDEEGARNAAEAIMTTDTVIKTTALRGYLPTGSFNLGGIAKGAGMICPNMATMLAFLATDARISRNLLCRLFQEAVDDSFNLITVDGDTSTNDTAIILANGTAPGVDIIEGTPACDLFQRMLKEACRDLAYQIVADGEGATKIIALTLRGAADRASARVLAMAVLNSPLVKTAFYGQDANWGRLLSALGASGIAFDPSRVNIFLGPVQVAARGSGVPFREEEARAVLEKREIPVVIDLGAGEVELQAWGTDLTHDYVTINGSYRT